MTPDLLLHIFSLFLFCLILASLEAQAEGEAGWAANFPTWRPAGSRWYARFYKKFMSNKDMTGYHLSVFSLVLIFLHYPYFVNRNWSFSSELTTISFFFLVAIIWDFLWFVINPRYDFGAFWTEHVWWHKRWFLHLPIDYWFGFMLSALLYMRFSLNWALFQEWLEIIALFFILTLAVVIFAIVIGVFKIKQKTDN